MAVTSAVKISEFEFGNRFDAELYHPSLCESFDSLNRVKYELTRLRHACLIRSGTTPPDRVDGLQEGAILYKTTDIRNSVIPSRGGYYRISDAIHHRMSKTRISEGDVLLNIVGATLEVIGRSGFVAHLENEANITQAMAFLRSRTPQLLSGYLFTYLNTRFAQDQIARYARPTGQYNLNLQEVGYILIPLLPLVEQEIIEQTIYQSSSLLEQADDSYTQAQQLLESELGLNKLHFNKPVGYTARFSVVGLSDSVNANRIDAQCFSPEAVFYEHWLLKQANCDRLGLLLSNTAKGRQQTEAKTGTTDYCSIKHITGREIVGASKTYPAVGTPAARKDDLLLAITGATIGKIGIVNRYSNIVFSGDMLRLRANGSVSPHYLLLTLDHYLGQVQFNRWITGSTNGHLAPRDIGRVLVPRLASNKEEHIAALVADSLEKRQESELLLFQAKSRVEQLIEEAIRT